MRGARKVEPRQGLAGERYDHQVLVDYFFKKTATLREVWLTGRKPVPLSARPKDGRRTLFGML